MSRIKDALNDILAETEDLKDMLSELEDAIDDKDLAVMIGQCKGRADMIWHLANGAMQEPEVADR